MKLEAKAVMFGSLHGGGHIQVHELIHYPGIMVEAVKKDRKSDWTRDIVFEGKQFPNFKSAIEAWKVKNAKANS